MGKHVIVMYYWQQQEDYKFAPLIIIRSIVDCFIFFLTRAIHRQSSMQSRLKQYFL